VPELAARLERLDTIFGVELAERIQHLNALLDDLEKTGANGTVPAIARALHSLKGAARAVESSTVEQVVHAAETATTGQTGRPNQSWLGAMRSALDGLPALHRDRSADVSAIVGALATPKAETAPVRLVSERVERPDPGSVRVALSKLDTLLTESGELSVTQLRIDERLTELRNMQRQLERWQRDWNRTRPARARMRREGYRSLREAEIVLRAADRADHEIQSLLQRARDIAAGMAQNASQLATVASAISEEVMAIRLLPTGTIFLPLERLVRDLSRQTQKDVRLELVGSDTELDRRILDELRDPLMHMVRNSVDHGFETPEERREAGKTAQGTLRLSAVQRGDRVQVVIQDDGRGLDIDAIRATAIRRKVLSTERAEQMDAAELIGLIFHAGFSTREAVTEISGRGVGMDVVRDNVRRLGGDIRVDTTPGIGTTFTINVPLTLATTRVLLVENAGLTYAIPSSSIERTGRVRSSQLRALEGRTSLKVDGRVLPVVELASVLQQSSAPVEAGWRPFFVLSQSGERAVAVLTDRLVDETELVVKPLGAPLKRVRHVTGAAVLGTGSVVVILNPADLYKSSIGTVEGAQRLSTSSMLSEKKQDDKPQRRVMVVDDSVMTRTLERSILESAGYGVVVAGDGAQALELLNEQVVDAIVSDVEMPRMTGLQLTEALRNDERWRHLPIVLVTSLDAPEHVERGAAAGADAYIVKGRFDQNDLLQTIARLV
jgi:two-component system chemotaxis sensor kinase CheA